MANRNAVHDGLAVTFDEDDLAGVFQIEINVERAPERLVVSPEEDVLARLDLSLDVAAGNLVFLEVVRIVGQEASCQVNRAVGGVEELEPGAVLAEVILEVGNVDHQVLVQAHLALALSERRRGLYGVFGIFVFIYQFFKLIFLFFTGRNLQSDLPEDIEVKKIIEMKNPKTEENKGLSMSVYPSDSIVYGSGYTSPIVEDKKDDRQGIVSEPVKREDDKEEVEDDA